MLVVTYTTDGDKSRRKNISRQKYRHITNSKYKSTK